MRNPFATPAAFDDWLSTHWAECLRQALEGMIGAVAPITASPSDAPPEPEAGWLWSEHIFADAQDAPLWVGAPRTTWTGFAAKIFEAAGMDSGGEQEAQNTYLEVVQQACSGLSGTLTAVCGREIRCAQSRLAAKPPDPPWIRFLIAGGIDSPIYLAWAPRLREVFCTQDTAAVAGSELAKPDHPPASAPTPLSKIEVLFDVELPVSISFGRAQLPLREVLKLTSGSVVELNRTVAEPVDVVVNNCVIARGEVVVVDGNYGVKITEIATHNERLKSLR